jgi:CubicO group peptidase (beta-lactamase class C family)
MPESIATTINTATMHLALTRVDCALTTHFHRNAGHQDNEKHLAGATTMTLCFRNWILLVGLACFLTLSSRSVGAQPGNDECWSSVVAGGPHDPRFDAIRHKMRKAIVEDGVPSIAVAVAVDGKLIWQEACGLADRERLVRATPDTPYDIGSTSKTFTATGLMVLKQRGLVDLNRPADDYLGRAKLTAFVGDASAATLKLVMQHRAGLPMHANFIYENEPYRRPPMEDTISRYGIIVRAPGETYNYANLDYGIVEYIISRVSAISYEDFMRAEVFLPLGLNRTSVGPLPQLSDITAAPYDDDGSRLPRMDLDQRGAGFIYSTVNDLIRFGMFHLKEPVSSQRRILNEPTIDMMVNEQVPTGTRTWAYGLGWDIHHNEYDSGLTSVRHSGGMAGFAGVLKLIPAKGIAVAVLSNSRRAGTITLSEDIVSILLPDYGVKRAKELASQAPSTEQPPFHPTADFTGTWKGVVKTWQNELPIRMEIKPDGEVHVKMGDQLETLLTKIEFSNGELNGSFQGTIRTVDAERDRHTVYLDRLVVRGDTMFGTAIADGKAHFALPSWIKLIRQSPSR